MSFYGGIKSYDIHTYYNYGDEAEREFASSLRDRVLEEFSQEIEDGKVRVHKFWTQPIGPHPTAMWECDFNDITVFNKIVPWFQLNHGKLSVLIHPRSDLGDLKDHTDHALWLGHKQRLITHILK
ncbi:unnamed protein product [Kuraishia capsulata CBS 1993]|uniref:DOPA 4,5-dioxygenase n=1 Tax=Kuraishia capsulata CBS 1993 TaxID=1382522 RepID=W6MRT0_9ASCO|nr:uncharacterized protein KUCA_T00005412001 [Kuraishia capsulata CBS 1993]CDK29424.1 unnamed protein product [Kuraishia capsulata CBS 1993]